MRGIEVLGVLLGVERPAPVDEGCVEGRLELGQLLVADRQLEGAVRQLCGRSWWWVDQLVESNRGIRASK